MKKKKQLSLEDPEAFAAFMKADELPKKSLSSLKKPSDPHAGKEIKCAFCWNKICKGERYCSLGYFILCKSCYDSCYREVCHK